MARGLSSDGMAGMAMDDGSPFADSSMLTMYSRCWARSRVSSSSVLLLLLPTATNDSSRFREKGSFWCCHSCKSLRQSVDSSSIDRMASSSDSSTVDSPARMRPSKISRERHDRIAFLVDSNSDSVSAPLLLCCCCFFSNTINRSYKPASVDTQTLS